MEHKKIINLLGKATPEVPRFATKIFLMAHIIQAKTLDLKHHS